jgi:hypothetical protein
MIQSIVYSKETVMVVIAWLLDLQLPVHLVPITTKVVSSNHADDKVYSIQYLRDKVCQWRARLAVFSGFLHQ